MFRCKDCKTIYKNKVDYCECGNNIFEEIPDEPVMTQAVEENYDIVPKKKLLPIELMSIVVFLICCIFSLFFVLFLGPEPTKRIKAPVKKEKVVVKNFPSSIEKIWDSTPAYTLEPATNQDLNLYKDGLRKFLLSNFNIGELEGSGACDVSFILDRHGNLKKKKLYQNTANKPLLDTAKRMLSKSKIYNAPPKTYDGTPLTLEVKAIDAKTYTLKYKY